MKIPFVKLQGTGNDFVLIDAIKNPLSLSTAQVQFLCDRKFGIGSDGLLLLESGEDCDFHLTFYNPDGSESFCGNGSRCAVRYFCDSYETSSCKFSGFDGMHLASLEGDIVSLEMRISGELQSSELGTYINTGAPHLVVSTRNLNELDIDPSAKPLRWHEKFAPVGVNVNFYEKAEKGVNMRTFEKGVEAETLSCGTGVTAVALNYLNQHPNENGVDVHTKGGNLRVDKDANKSGTYWLQGPALWVYTGEISL